MTADAQVLRLLVADEDPRALAQAAAQLERMGHDVVAQADSPSQAYELAERIEPDAALIVLYDNPQHDLEIVARLAGVLDGPVVVLADPPDADFLAAAAELGISAFAAARSDEELRAALEVGMRLHRHRASLETRVGTLTSALTRRGAIERAKGVLMERDGISEVEAQARLEALARRDGRRVADVAADLAHGRR